MNLDAALMEIRFEYQKARERFPPFHTAHEGYAVLLEEVDELWDEVKRQYSGERDKAIHKEALQVAAMALAMMLECSRGDP